jgi:cellulase/cellobiase CelA1
MIEIDKKWYKLARRIANAGNIPVPINETLIEILQILIKEEYIDFIASVFRKPSLNMEQIEKRTD